MSSENTTRSSRKSNGISLREAALVLAVLLSVRLLIGLLRPVIQDRTMVDKMVRRYDLTQAIAQYDQVIDVIELYQDDHGSYPRELQALVPDYLSEVPGVYVRAGEVLEYAVESEGIYSFSYDAPFVFYVYGHHTGLQFMHGWELRYCPIEYDSCNQAGGRDYHPHRIDDRWVWINRSAL